MPLLVEDGLSELRQWEALFPSAVTITRTSPRRFGSRQLVVSGDGGTAGDAPMGRFRHA